MISLDRVLLLEQKVEEAVVKISQLQAENTALRNKCTDLVNMLSTKSEQLSSFRQDQDRIENGILKALDRLNSIENSILNAAEQAARQPTEAAGAEDAPLNQQQEAPQAPVEQNGEGEAAPNQMSAEVVQAPVPNVPAQDSAEGQNTSAENGQFDIF